MAYKTKSRFMPPQPKKKAVLNVKKQEALTEIEVRTKERITTHVINRKHGQALRIGDAVLTFEGPPRGRTKVVIQAPEGVKVDVL